MQKKFEVVNGPASVQGSEEWLDFRRTKIGASMAPIILGIDPWTTKLQLWEQITYNKERQVTSSMQRGKDLEPLAREWVCDFMSIDYKPAVLQSKGHPFLIASLDGFFEYPDGTVSVVEIKVPNRETHNAAAEGKIPQHYFAQMQHQMIVSGADSVIYCSFDGKDGVVTKCERDDQFCHDLVSSEIAFLDAVVNFEPPEASDKDWIEISDPTKIMMVDEYKFLKEKKAMLEKRMDELTHELTRDSVNPRLRFDDFKMRKMPGKVTIDYKSFLNYMNLVPDDKYKKKGKDYWRITCSNA